MNTENNKIYDSVPDDVLKLSEDIIGFKPSILETDFYTVELLQLILKTNKIIWSNKYYNGSICCRAFSFTLIDGDAYVVNYADYH